MVHAREVGTRVSRPRWGRRACPRSLPLRSDGGLFPHPVNVRRGCVKYLVLFAATATAGCATLSTQPLPSPEQRLSLAEQSALAAYRSGDAAEAYRQYRALATASESRPDLHRTAAACARQAGLVLEALGSRQAAVALDPEDRWSRMWIARLLLAAHNPAMALAELGEPANAWEFLTQGQILRRLSRPEDALAVFERARAADPKLSLVEQERGETLEALGRHAEAAQAYAAAIALDPSFTHLQIRLAHLESKLGKTEAAYERYRKFLLVDASHPVARAEKARLAQTLPRLARKELAREQMKVQVFRETLAPRFKPLPPTPLSPIAVGIISDVSDFRVKCASECSLESDESAPLTIPGQTEIQGKLSGTALRLTWSGGGASLTSAARLMSKDPDATFTVFNVHFEKGYYWSDQENRSYRGTLEIIPKKNKITFVNHVQLEDYLLSVIPSEMPASWPLEALKAQAVAARTEALKKLGRHRHEGFNICSTQHCAVYRGTINEMDAPSRAVLETRGKVLLIDGEPLDTVYAANCGGWGSSGGEIWGSGSTILPAVCDLPPAAREDWNLVPVNPDIRQRFFFERVPAYCNHSQQKKPYYSASYRWVRSYTHEELSNWVHRRYQLGRLKRITPKTLTTEGWLTSVELEGEAGVKEVKRDAIRTAFNTIRSNFFTMEILPATVDTPAQYLFVGAGWGHGAGMCQHGAYGLALTGKSAHQILKHYYPKAKLTKLY